MCFRGPSRQALRVSRFRERHRMQPREDCYNRAYGAAQEFEASPEVHRLPCFAQQISQSAGCESNPIISAYEEDGEIHLDITSKRGIPRAQAHAIHCTDSGRPNRVVSAVMVVERPEKDKAQQIQRPVYYISEVLSASKQNYPHYQMMCYGVYMSAKILKPYFQAHLITVVSSAPLADIIGSRDATGRVAKWAIEVASHGIQYEPRTAIKSQALADFLVDWAETQYMPQLPVSGFWRMHFDGSKMKSGLWAGVVLTSPRGDQLQYMLQIHFATSNSVAEYEALVHGIKLAKEIGIRNIECFGDSDLVVQQCSGTWDAKDANMASYRFLVQQINGYFEGCEFHHVPRANNEAEDALSKLGSTRQAIPPGVSLEHIKKPSIIPSLESESIFISETDLEALRKAKEAQPAKIPTLKKQSGAQGAPASAEPTAPGAADCKPGVADCSKKKKSKGKEQAAVPDDTALEEPMTSGTANCIEEISIPNEKPSPGAAKCEPGAATGSPEARDAEMAEVQDIEIQEAVVPQQAMVMVVISAPS